MAACTGGTAHSEVRPLAAVESDFDSFRLPAPIQGTTCTQQYATTIPGVTGGANYSCDSDVFATTTLPARADKTHGVVQGVARGPDGAPLRGLVDVSGLNIAVVASSDGHYSVALPPGAYGVEFAPFDRAPLCEAFHVRLVAHDTATVDIDCR